MCIRDSINTIIASRLLPGRRAEHHHVATTLDPLAACCMLQHAASDHPPLRGILNSPLPLTPTTPAGPSPSLTVTAPATPATPRAPLCAPGVSGPRWQRAGTSYAASTALPTTPPQCCRRPASCQSARPRR
eukprot:12407469-Alexandrium_andersonii.AAC.2